MIGSKQQRELINRLTHLGWEIVSQQRNDLEWWADEIWTVESVWSPHGFRVYLTFLVDPHPPSTGVWAVGASSEWPANHWQAQDRGLAGRSTWPHDLPVLIAALSDLRAQAAQEIDPQ